MGVYELKLGKQEFLRRAGYTNFQNIRWSWGSTNDAGEVLLLVWQDECERVERGVLRVWVYGGHTSDTDLGGLERQDHLDRIRAGTPAVAAICVCTDLTEEKSHEKIESILPTLWRVAKVEEPDERGRVHVILRHPDLSK